MIKETPPSRLGVVLAFAGTAFVALLPLGVLASVDADLRAAIGRTVANAAGPVALVAGIVVALAVGVLAVKSMVRRRLRAASI